MQSFSITFPLDPALHAHASGKWYDKAKPVKNAREMGYYLAIQERVRLTGRVRVFYRFEVPDRLRRDEANMIHHCKPVIDGVVDSGAIPGDHWEVLSIGGVETAFVPSDNLVKQVMAVLRFEAME